MIFLSASVPQPDREFFGTENFQKDNSVIVLMDNQGTSTIYDDEILSVRLDPFAD